ncbi:MAG TPA: helix-turn-helix domain-containing protein [Chitinophaga sp.]|uniref:GlxA family transcriptional regulator n=1 Tax=Chitinophaga sp. TaxID=1869181 RepID=UPI002CF1F055|nr:helix-turn-helix domain-containing protein [Chitinophaga sp.]HVI45072.1 helix-turn-helix domain-containing protein [Chitinophaga sp.]
MKQVTLVVPECLVNLNSLGGAYEILVRADALWQKAGNRPRLNVSIAGFMAEQSSHNNYLSIHPVDITDIKRTDLVILPALLDDYMKAVRQNKALIDWIRTQYKRGAEVASMCSGSFLLAATGLLEGKVCSVHWGKVDEFRQMYPGIQIAQDTIVTEENGIYTNGGAYSFLHLIIYLVEKLFDRPTAVLCAKFFQIDIDRTSQSQFSIFNAQKGHGDELITRAQSYIEENIDVKISFEKLASDLAVSRRNFDRRFIKATGNTPVEYLQRVKVEAAKKELERGRKTVYEVMSEVGYSDDKAFREVFKRITGLSPLDYRNKYNRELTVAWQ